MIVLETALPIKFAATIVEALGARARAAGEVRRHRGLPKRVTVLPADAEAVKYIGDCDERRALRMKVVGFAGYSGSGKTTLVERLIPALKRLRGLRVSVVKHAHHKFDIDHPGKDTYRHREAGAFEVVVASDRRLAVMREFEQPAELSVHQLLAELLRRRRLGAGRRLQAQQPAEDRGLARPRAASRPAILYDDFIVAIATDTPASCRRKPLRPVLDLNDPDAVAQWLVDNGDRFEYNPEHVNPRLPSAFFAPARRCPGRGLLAQAEPVAGSETGFTFDADGRVLAEDLVSACRCRRRTTARWTATPCAAPRCADEGVPLPVSQRIPAGAAPQPLQPARRRASSPARRFPRAPTRS
jgi:molybdopterin-guanine dinucleotide biosynthesis protein B